MPLMAKGDDSGSKQPTCYTVTVVDGSATTAAKEACNAAAQKLIDQYQEEIDECVLELENYNTLLTDIQERHTLAGELSDSYAQTQAIIDDANLNSDLGLCKNCLENLKNTFTNMENDCNDKIKEFTQKKEAAEKNLEKATQSKNDCADIVKYKKQTYCTW